MAKNNTKDRFSSETVLQAIQQLYSPVGRGGASSAKERRRVDQYLCDFQRSDAAIPVSLTILRGVAERQMANGMADVAIPPEAVLLLATCVRRRLQRGQVPRSDKSADDLMQLAVMLASGGSQVGRRAADLLVRGFVAKQLHEGSLPIKKLLAASAGAEPSARLALVALAALPEEANAREVKIAPQLRPHVLLELAGAAPEVLSMLGGLTGAPAAARLDAATQWLCCCDANLEILGSLASSPLLELCANALSRGDGTPELEAASTLLEALLEKSAGCPSYPAALVEALLRLLGSVQPSGPAERNALCNLVASATSAWRNFFIEEHSSASFAAWASLLEALVTCSSWGHDAAGISLSAWLGLWERIVKAGPEAKARYAPVLAKAVEALRIAATVPERFVGMPADDREAFFEYRRELRDALRYLAGDDLSLRAFALQLVESLAARRSSTWEALEETLHALSSLSKGLLEMAGRDAEGAGIAEAIVKALAVLACDPALGLLEGRGHRQLVVSYLTCANVYAPLFVAGGGSAIGATIADEALAAMPAKTLLLQRVVLLARASLAIEEEPAKLPDAAFPFRVKQDHSGVVCLLKLFNGSTACIAAASADVMGTLRSDLVNAIRAWVMLATKPTLERHSVAVLGQALGFAARCLPELAHQLLSECLAILRDLPGHTTALCLTVCTEVVTSSGVAQPDALAAAVEPFWGLLAEGDLDAPSLAALLSAFADKLPLAAVEPVAKVLASNFQRRPPARAPLLKAATSVVQRVAKTPGTSQVEALALELIRGLGAAVWASLDAGHRASCRIASLAENAVLAWEAEEEYGAMLTSAEKALVESWAKCVHETGKAAPAVLSADVLQVTWRAAASVLAVPHKEPPDKTLALLSELWKPESGLLHVLQAALEVPVFDQSWPLGALVLRGTCKALLGQMPPNALGVVVPAARAIFQHNPMVSEAWLRCAIASEGFPCATMKLEAKERFVKELMGSLTDAQKFKQALKRFCGGKKKGAGLEP